MAAKRAGNRGKGRPKGSKNKTTVAVKDAVLGALDEVGGRDYLVTVARENPRAFCALLGRLIPTEVKAEHGGDVSHTVTVVVKRDRNFFGRGPAPRALAPPSPDPGKPGPVQGGGVRPAVG